MIVDKCESNQAEYSRSRAISCFPALSLGIDSIKAKRSGGRDWARQGLAGLPSNRIAVDDEISAPLSTEKLRPSSRLVTGLKSTLDCHFQGLPYLNCAPKKADVALIGTPDNERSG